MLFLVLTPVVRKVPAEEWGVAERGSDFGTRAASRLALLTVRSVKEVLFAERTAGGNGLLEGPCWGRLMHSLDLIRPVWLIPFRRGETRQRCRPLE